MEKENKNLDGNLKKVDFRNSPGDFDHSNSVSQMETLEFYENLADFHGTSVINTVIDYDNKFRGDFE